MCLKVLTLHGFGSNLNVMQKQLQVSNFERELSSLIKFDKLEAIHEVPGRTESIPLTFNPPFYAWWRSKNIDGKISYEGWTKTLDYVQDYVIKEGPFEGLLGFSQGACLASVLLGLQQLEKFESTFKFGILVGGFKSRFDGHSEAFCRKISVPSLHIRGKQDPLVSQGRDLASSFVDPIVIEHEGGHVMPRMTETLKETVILLATDVRQASKL